MQVWTMASGKTAVIASGKPFRPSTTAISTSSTPRFLSSVMTRSQNLAPSVCSIHGQRYIVCRNEAEAEKDATDHAAIIVALDQQLKRGDKALIGNSAYRRYLPARHF